MESGTLVKLQSTLLACSISDLDFFQLSEGDLGITLSESLNEHISVYFFRFRKTFRILKTNCQKFKMKKTD
jgi:hypothetical protein